jgi:hypothetical protein
MDQPLTSVEFGQYLRISGCSPSIEVVGRELAAPARNQMTSDAQPEIVPVHWWAMFVERHRDFET